MKKEININNSTYFFGRRSIILLLQHSIIICDYIYKGGITATSYMPRCKIFVVDVAYFLTAYNTHFKSRTQVNSDRFLGILDDFSLVTG